MNTDLNLLCALSCLEKQRSNDIAQLHLKKSTVRMFEISAKA